METFYGGSSNGKIMFPLKLAKMQTMDLDKVFEAVDILADGDTLNAKYCDHDLSEIIKEQ